MSGLIGLEIIKNVDSAAFYLMRTQKFLKERKFDQSETRLAIESTIDYLFLSLNDLNELEGSQLSKRTNPTARLVVVK